MARNRKNMSAAVRFGPSIKALLLCLFIGGAGVGYVWQKNQILAMGRQITGLESRYRDLVRLNQMRAQQLDSLRSPAALDRQVRKLNLGLVQPPPSQVVSIIETRVNEAATTLQQQQLAVRSGP